MIASYGRETELREIRLTPNLVGVSEQVCTHGSLFVTRVVESYCKVKPKAFAGNYTVCHSGLQCDEVVNRISDPRRRRTHSENNMSESLRFLGSLEGHKGWVTAIATSSENPDMILTASRGTLRAARYYCPIVLIFIDH